MYTTAMSLTEFDFVMLHQVQQVSDNCPSKKAAKLFNLIFIS